MRAFLKNESGSAAVEYGLIIALVAAVSIATIKTIGTDLATHWTRIDANVPTSVPAPVNAGASTSAQ